MVNLPIFLDLVQPANEIIAIKEAIPKKNEMEPKTRGRNKSLSTTLNGYPTVVFINTLVIAKTVIKKKLAAKVETTIIVFDNLVFTSETNKFAITAIENPPSKELIVIVCSANLFQYSKVISVIYSVRFFYSKFYYLSIFNSAVMFFPLAGNDLAIFSTGFKSTKLSVNYLAKFFYFVLPFSILKPNQKIWRTLLKALNFILSTKPRINYSFCCV